MENMKSGIRADGADKIENLNLKLQNNMSSQNDDELAKEVKRLE